jgi:hypothetical protein
MSLFADKGDPSFVASRPQCLGCPRTSLACADDHNRVVAAGVKIDCRGTRPHRLAHLSG